MRPNLGGLESKEDFTCRGGQIAEPCGNKGSLETLPSDLNALRSVYAPRNWRNDSVSLVRARPIRQDVLQPDARVSFPVIELVFTGYPARQVYHQIFSQPAKKRLIGRSELRQQQFRIWFDQLQPGLLP